MIINIRTRFIKDAHSHLLSIPCWADVYKIITSSGVKKIIRCFCNCTELTEEDVKNILKADVRGVLCNKLGNTLFRKYAELGNRLDVPYAVSLLDGYEICDRVIVNSNSCYEHHEQIQQFNPDFALECELEELVSDRAPLDRIVECVKEIQLKYIIELEQTEMYRDFRKALIDKIKK